MIRRINCKMEIDEETETVTIRSAKWDTILAMFKIEGAAFGTMQRIKTDEDCDNYWLAVKPGDRIVFEENLFGRKHLVVKSINFILSEGW